MPKRKRPHAKPTLRALALPRKRQRVKHAIETPSTNDVHHPVLNNYYPRVLKLRHWLLEKLAHRHASNRRQALVKHAVDGTAILDGVLVGCRSDSRNAGAPSDQHQSVSTDIEALESFGVAATQALGTARGTVAATATAAAKGGGGRIAAYEEVGAGFTTTRACLLTTPDC